MNGPGIIFDFWLYPRQIRVIRGQKIVKISFLATWVKKFKNSNLPGFYKTGKLQIANPY